MVPPHRNVIVPFAPHASATPAVGSSVGASPMSRLVTEGELYEWTSSVPSFHAQPTIAMGLLSKLARLFSYHKLPTPDGVVALSAADAEKQTTMNREYAHNDWLRAFTEQMSRHIKTATTSYASWNE